MTFVSNYMYFLTEISFIKSRGAALLKYFYILYIRKLKSFRKQKNFNM